MNFPGEGSERIRYVPTRRRSWPNLLASKWTLSARVGREIVSRKGHGFQSIEFEEDL